MPAGGESLRDALLLQRREAEALLQSTYVERDMPERRLPPSLIKVVLGPRRAGKSFFSLHLVRDLGDFGYVNFDDEHLANLDDVDALISALDALYDRPKRLLLDEVQNVPRWELLVNRMQRQGRDLTITGSNAHLLSSELATHLTGRHLPIVLFPFSFREVVRAQGRELTNSEKAELLRVYAESGGYPEPMLKAISHRDYLTTLVRSILYKDIVVRHRIRAPQSLEDLAHHLMANVASPYSYHSLVRGTRLQSVHTAEKYLQHLEEAFLFFSLRRFSFKARERATGDRKIYAIDNGLVTATGFRSSPDRGKLYENLVAIDLHRRELEGELECYSWKGEQGDEVDFVIKEGPRVTQLVQVCYNLESPRTKAREVRALLKASRELGCDSLLVLTDSEEGEERASWFGTDGTICFVPLWRWLLEGSAMPEEGTTKTPSRRKR